jgi:ribonuclease R
LKEFLLRVSEGIKEKDVLKKNRELFDFFVRGKFIKKKGEVYKLDSRYRFGVLDVNRNGTGYLETFSIKKNKDLLIEGFDLNSASKGDIVLAKRIFSRGGRPKAKVIEILQKEYPTTVVYTKKQNNKIVGINIRTQLPTVIASSQKALKKLPIGTVLKVDNYTDVITEVLGVLDDPKVDEKISLALYDKKEEFPKKAILEAQSYGDSVDKSMYLDRVDLSSLDFCTIDPLDAKDFDDAIYYDKEQKILYVAIADVSSYVAYNSNIDKEAFKRGFTIYFPHKAVPMLPRELSENICSLKPNVDRLAYVYKIWIDEDSLEVKRSQRFEALINSKRRYTYDKIDEFLVGEFNKVDEVDERILDFLLPLKKLLFKMREKRLQNGCEFRSQEIGMELDESGKLIRTKIEVETPSHSLIEDAMLLANKEASKDLQRGIFRVHEKPSFAKLDDMLDTLATIGIYSDEVDDTYSMIRSLQKRADEKGLRAEVDKLIIKAQQQARYESENKGHFGLGFDSYTHFTSPIRRYSDLVVHRLLKLYAKDKDDRNLRFMISELEIIAQRVSELERESAKVAWDFMDRKYARWAKENIGVVLEAVITDMDRTPIAVTTDENIQGMRIFLIDQDVELFERVQVEIVEAHITSAKVIGVISNKDV